MVVVLPSLHILFSIFCLSVFSTLGNSKTPQKSSKYTCSEILTAVQTHSWGLGVKYIQIQTQQWYRSSTITVKGEWGAWGAWGGGIQEVTAEGNHNKNRNPDVQNDWGWSLAQSEREVCWETKSSPAVCQPQSHNACPKINRNRKSWGRKVCVNQRNPSSASLVKTTTLMLSPF